MKREEARAAAINEAVEFFLGDEFKRVTVQEQFGKLFDAGYQAGSEGRGETIHQAIARLEGACVQNNKHHLGLLGSDDIDAAIRLLKSLED